jgi:hypothetical protein
MQIEPRCPDCDVPLREVVLLPDGPVMDSGDTLVLSLEKDTWYGGCTRCETVYRVKLNYSQGVFD